MRFTVLILIAAVSIRVVTAMAAPQSENPSPKAYGDTEYRLGPDDVIQVFVWKDADLSTTAVIRPDGKVSVPLIGELVANGKTSVELEREVAKRLAQYVTEPVVSVIVKEVNSKRMSVLGEVKNPGMYKVMHRATVFEAVALAGGFTEYAKRNRVTIIRTTPSGEEKRIKLNMEKQIKDDKGNLFYVLPSDRIWVH